MKKFIFLVVSLNISFLCFAQNYSFEEMIKLVDKSKDRIYVRYSDYNEIHRTLVNKKDILERYDASVIKGVKERTIVFKKNNYQMTVYIYRGDIYPNSVVDIYKSINGETIRLIGKIEKIGNQYIVDGIEEINNTNGKSKILYGKFEISNCPEGLSLKSGNKEELSIKCVNLCYRTGKLLGYNAVINNIDKRVYLDISETRRFNTMILNLYSISLNDLSAMLNFDFDSFSETHFHNAIILMQNRERFEGDMDMTESVDGYSPQYRDGLYYKNGQNIYMLSCLIGDSYMLYYENNNSDTMSRYNSFSNITFRVENNNAMSRYYLYNNSFSKDCNDVFKQNITKEESDSILCFFKNGDKYTGTAYIPTGELNLKLTQGTMEYKCGDKFVGDCSTLDVDGFPYKGTYILNNGKRLEGGLLKSFNIGGKYKKYLSKSECPQERYDVAKKVANKLNIRKKFIKYRAYNGGYSFVWIYFFNPYEQWWSSEQCSDVLLYDIKNQIFIFYDNEKKDRVSIKIFVDKNKRKLKEVKYKVENNKSVVDYINYFEYYSNGELKSIVSKLPNGTVIYYENCFSDGKVSYACYYEKGENGKYNIRKQLTVDKYGEKEAIQYDLWGNFEKYISWSPDSWIRTLKVHDVFYTNEIDLMEY